MPTKSIPLIDYKNPASALSIVSGSSNLGLACAGSPELYTANFLRRATGVHESCFGFLRPRSGDSLLFAVGTPIHSISRFNDRRFYAFGASIYADGGQVWGLNGGGHVEMLPIPPGNTQPDQLFFADGFFIGKVSSGNLVTNWGLNSTDIEALVASKETAHTLVIDEFDTTVGWTQVGDTEGFNIDVNAFQFTTSLQLFIGKFLPVDEISGGIRRVGGIQKLAALDLTHYADGSVSPAEDSIEFWAYSYKQAYADVEYITLRFDVGDGSFVHDYYQYTFFLSDTTPVNQIPGLGDNPVVSGDELLFLQSIQRDRGASSNNANQTISALQGVNTLGSGASFLTGPQPTDGSVLLSAHQTWTRLRVAKSRFFRSGAGTGTWANVTGVQLLIGIRSDPVVGVANGVALINFDRMRLGGGAGLIGRYRYLFSFENTVTGAQSNSNAAFAQVEDVERSAVTLTGISVAGDSQVTRRKVWRTLGGGGRFFLIDDINDNTSTTYTDQVADYYGLDTNATKVMQAIELPTDNTKPASAFFDFIYDQSVVFWLTNAAGQKGRCYFSPPGRPESERGFFQVSSDDKPLFKLVIWNRARYIWGESGPYRIDTVNNSYVPYHFNGVAGVAQAQRLTVVSTPYGVIWQAPDGIRVFTGSSSELLFFDRVGPLFRGKSLESYFAFEGICAAYGRNQYFISNGIQTFSFNLATGFIRELGVGYTALYFEEDTGILLGGRSDGLVIVENEVTTTTGRFEIQTSALFSQPGTENIVQRILFSVQGNNQTLTPVYILDDVEYALPPFVVNGRQVVEYAIGKTYQTFAVRITAEVVTTDFRLYQIIAEVYQT